MEKCIVCGRPLLEHANMCGNCGFSTKKQYFLSKQQYRMWMNDVVIPRRLAQQQIELDNQRRQLEAQRKSLQEQQRQREEQQRKEAVKAKSDRSQASGWENTGWEKPAQKTSKQNTLRRNAADSWLPPGFRTKTWWKMLLAGGYYIFILAAMFTGETLILSDGTTASSAQNLFFSVCGCLTFFLPVFFLADYRGFRNKLPLPSNRFFRIILCAGITVFLFIAPAVVFGIFYVFLA